MTPNSTLSSSFSVPFKSLAELESSETSEGRKFENKLIVVSLFDVTFSKRNNSSTGKQNWSDAFITV